MLCMVQTYYNVGKLCSQLFLLFPKNSPEVENTVYVGTDEAGAKRLYIHTP